MLRIHMPCNRQLLLWQRSFRFILSQHFVSVLQHCWFHVRRSQFLKTTHIAYLISTDVISSELIGNVKWPSSPRLQPINRLIGCSRGKLGHLTLHSLPINSDESTTYLTMIRHSHSKLSGFTAHSQPLGSDEMRSGETILENRKFSKLKSVNLVAILHFTWLRICLICQTVAVSWCTDCRV